MRFRLRGPRAPADDAIVIVGLDDRVRAEVPKLNQERAQWAVLLRRIAAGRPRVVGVDYLFDTPEELIPPDIVRQARAQHQRLQGMRQRADLPADLRETLGRVLTLLGRILTHAEGDARLARALRQAGNVHLGVLFRFPGEARPSPPVGAVLGAVYPEAVTPEGLPRRREPPRAVAASGITPSLARAVAGAGFVNNILESDGASRRFYTAIKYRGRIYAPLSIQLAARYLGLPPGGLTYVAGSDALVLGKRRAWLDPRGRLWVNFLGPAGTFRTVSAADVMAGRVPPSVFRDKIVLVGPTDATNPDRVVTPFDPLLPGVEFHATVIHNLLHNESLRAAGWLVGLGLLLLLGGLASALFLVPGRRRGLWISAGLLLLLGGHWAGVQLLFARYGVVVQAIFPGLTVLGAAGVGLVAAYLTEGREKRRIRKLFQYYLHADVIRDITRDPTGVRLGGERREVTVLFSDIRGFSHLAEGMDPQELAQFVNAYLTPMTDVVLDEQGYLDKYIGDAIMAVFGAPKAREDHARLAARSALGMLERLEALNRAWDGQPFAPVRIGVGINSGPVSLGNFGSQRRIEYTAMGDTVNLASRLEGLNKVYGTSILLGEATREALGEAFWVREVDQVRVKGKDVAVRVYELIGERRPGTECPVDLTAFAEALAAYRQGDLEAAQQGFAGVRDARQADARDAVSQAFVARIDAMQAAGFDAEAWDGVFVMETK